MIDLVDFEHQQTDTGWERGLRFLGKLLGYPTNPPKRTGTHIKLYHEERLRSKIKNRLSRDEKEALRNKILELASRPEGVMSMEIMEVTGFTKQAVYYSLGKLADMEGLLVKEESTVYGNKQASKCNIFRLKNKEN